MSIGPTESGNTLRTPLLEATGGTREFFLQEKVPPHLYDALDAVNNNAFGTLPQADRIAVLNQINESLQRRLDGGMDPVTAKNEVMQGLFPQASPQTRSALDDMLLLQRAKAPAPKPSEWDQTKLEKLAEEVKKEVGNQPLNPEEIEHIAEARGIPPSALESFTAKLEANGVQVQKPTVTDELGVTNAPGMGLVKEAVDINLAANLIKPTVPGFGMGS